MAFTIKISADFNKIKRRNKLSILPRLRLKTNFVSKQLCEFVEKDTVELGSCLWRFALWSFLEAIHLEWMENRSHLSVVETCSRIYVERLGILFILSGLKDFTDLTTDRSVL